MADNNDIVTPWQEQLAELSVVVGGLAHEIKNPLSTITLNLKLLGEDLERFDDDEHRRLLRRLLCVQEETARIQRILDDFLQYAGKVELHAADTDICEVVREMRDFFTPQAEASRIVFRTQLPAQPVICKIDVNLIKQALLNLMINAVQAMNTGGELIVRVTTKGAFANIEVIDSGPGIPPENLNLIFKAYFSTKKSGSGLGLPTARRILKEHGGDMIVESEQGKGTCFLLKLPIVH